MKSGSSFRFMCTPTEWSGFAWMLIVIPSRASLCVADGGLAERAGRLLHRFHNVLVAGAPAQVSGEPLTNVGLARIGLMLEEGIGRQQHARRAVAALQAVLIPEALLQRVQFAVCREPFDGEDLVAVGLDGSQRKGVHCP